MTSRAYDQCRWHPCEIKGRSACYTEDRIDAETTPEGVFLYDLRHDDADWSEPAEMVRGFVLVNRFGTLASTTSLDGLLDEDGELWLDNADWDESCHLTSPPLPEAAQIGHASD